jgi:tetratricopeptide (TPR) repeat protein
MGMFSWLFPSDEDKLSRARADLAKGRFNDARLLALELNIHGAEEIVEQAEEALAKLNLAHAVSWSEANDPERVRVHLELAQELRKPGMDDDFAEARRQIRALDAARAEAEKARVQNEDSVLMEIDPGFRGDNAEDVIPLPASVSDDEAEALRARLAILFDGYPEALRPAMIDLGSSFVQAVLDLEDGRTEAALQGLVALPDDEPLVLHERARAAHALGDPAAAARAWTAFAKTCGQHHPIGNHHTAVLLSQVLAEAGQIPQALDVIQRARREDPELGGGLYASLLEASGDLAGSEKVLRHLLQKHGAQPSLYLAIARVRIRGGHRVLAMQALEKSLDQTVCTPGRCGYRPPDLATNRMLATLYLEDGQQIERALELAATAKGLVEQPTWDDIYLTALTEKISGTVQTPGLIRKLHDVTQEADPRFARLRQHLPLDGA